MAPLSGRRAAALVKVHRCAVLAAESRAGQYKYHDIQSAAAHLHGMLEALREAKV